MSHGRVRRSRRAISRGMSLTIPGLFGNLEHLAVRCALRQQQRVDVERLGAFPDNRQCFHRLLTGWNSCLSSFNIIPCGMNGPEIEEFLTHLAVKRKIPASTQQGINIVFFALQAYSKQKVSKFKTVRLVLQRLRYWLTVQTGSRTFGQPGPPAVQPLANRRFLVKIPLHYKLAHENTSRFSNTIP